MPDGSADWGKTTPGCFFNGLFFRSLGEKAVIIIGSVSVRYF